MIRSIRGRLQWWYGCVYALSILMFGSLVYWRADRDVHERATLQAVSAAQYLDANLRSLPKWKLAGESRPPEFGLGTEINDNHSDPATPQGTVFPGFHFRSPRETAERENLIRLPAQNWDHRGPPGRPRGRPQNPESAPDASQENFAADNPSAVGGKGPNPNGGGPSNPPPPGDRMEFAVWNAAGKLISNSEGDLIQPFLSNPPAELRDRSPRISFPEGVVRAQMKGPMDSMILVIRPMGHDISNLHRFGIQIAGMAAVTLVVGTVGGWWVSAKMVQPIQDISRTASQISVTSLDKRIETKHLDEELVQLAVVLNGAFERLEQSFERLTQFTADASHELRTPLAVIQSQIELALSQPRTTEAYQQTLKTCLASSERMRSLVDGLLLLARTDSEGMQIQPERIDLRQVAEDAVAQLQDRAQSHGVELECMSPDEDVTILGNVTFLTRIPANLIDNAIQHTPKGGTVTVEVSREGMNAVLTVKDSGHGIAKEHLEFLFDRFYRVDSGRSRSQGGSGLGLAICKSLVESHHGSIECESELDQGARFVVRFPLDGDKHA